MTVKRPFIKPHYCYQIVPTVGVFLLAENGYLLLKGSLYEKLIPLLTGELTDSDIVQQLTGDAPAAHIFYALGRLRRQGIIADKPSSLPKREAAYWHIAGAAVDQVETRLTQTAVSVHPLFDIDLTSFTKSLREQGVETALPGKLNIVITNNYLHPDLAAINQMAVTHMQPWLLIKPIGTEIWVGPLFVPGETGCWACFSVRLAGHRKIEAYLQTQSDDLRQHTTAVAALPSTRQLAFNIAATDISRWLVQGSSPLVGNVLSVDTLTWQQQQHSLTRRPQCPVCGNPQHVTQQQKRPFHLQSQPKQFTDDGGHRIQTPTATIAALHTQISPITGIISRLSPISDHPLTPAYAADHNTGWMHDDLYFLRESLRARTGGKGKTDAQARAGAIGESIERYAGVFQGDEARITAKMADLPGAIHPNEVMLFSEQQFADREAWNGRFAPFNHVPTRFDTNAVIDWTPVWSLTDKSPRHLPTAYCFYGYNLQHGITSVRPDSNGCAAGNSLEEAILQGFLELVERDGVALWWYNRLKRPFVDLDSFNDPYLAQLQQHYHDRQRDLWVLNLTSDLGIPTFAALSRRRSAAAEQIMMGFGAHLDAHIGVLRALTELNQMLPAAQRGMAQGETKLDQEVVEWWQNATIATHPYLWGNETAVQSGAKVAVATRAADFPTTATDDIHTDILHCAKLLQQHGMEMLLLNQTRPDTPLHVVKVIVPGLRHFWARFAPGRLYDVPVQLGWLPTPLPETELNPQPMFL